MLTSKDFAISSLFLINVIRLKCHPCKLGGMANTWSNTRVEHNPPFFVPYRQFSHLIFSSFAEYTTRTL